MRDKYLHEIDIAFMGIKRKKNDKERWNELTKNVKKFAYFNTVYFKVVKDWDNVSIFVKYSDNFIRFVKDYNTGGSTSIDRKKLAKYIDKVYIHYGDRFIDRSTNRELTATLLHELGHVYNHVDTYLTNLRKKAQGLAFISTIFMSFVSFPAFATLITVSRSLTFLEHRGEHKADAFATENGYGQEMIMVLNRYRMQGSPSKVTFFTKVIDYLNDIFLPGTHPRDRYRICRIANSMQKEYKDKYPKIKTDLYPLLVDLDCGSII